MRFPLCSHLLVVFACVTISFATVARGADATTPARTSPAEPLVTKALQAEAAGDDAERDSLIKQALKADPDYAPAHWHHGDVRTRERGIEVWKPVDEVAKDRADRGTVEKYRKLNPAANRKAEQWRKLGDWCDDAGLFNPALLHRSTALRMKPNLRDVQQKLGLVRYRNGFVPADQLEQIQKDEQSYAEAFKHWTRRLEKLQRDASVDSPSRQEIASKEIGEIDDTAAIPAMEALSVEGGPVFGVAVAASLAKMPEGTSTKALLRQAVCSQYPEVRQAASVALREKNVFAYAPTLIGMLKAPIRFQETDSFGQDTGDHQLVMFQEGPFAAQLFVSAGSYSYDSWLEISHKTHRPAWFAPHYIYHPDQSRDRDMSLAQKAAAYNSVVKVWNTNAMSTLSTATGVELDAAPTSWWTWWMNYNELYYNPQKPLYVSTSATMAPQPQHYVASCFVAGTKVWAMDGPVAIETVKQGEWVLAQNPATGEVAYKPVLATTIRPPSAVRAIKIKDDTIVATKGHPFWVCGKGWKMVKELEVGQSLHTLTGPTLILDAEYVGEAVCYNLVVADFGNYFVGEKKVLVHDNTIRDVTPAVVPGLMAEKP